MWEPSRHASSACTSSARRSGRRRVLGVGRTDRPTCRQYASTFSLRVGRQILLARAVSFHESRFVSKKSLLDSRRSGFDSRPMGAAEMEVLAGRPTSLNRATLRVPSANLTYKTLNAKRSEQSDRESVPVRSSSIGSDWATVHGMRPAAERLSGVPSDSHGGRSSPRWGRPPCSPTGWSPRPVASFFCRGPLPALELARLNARNFSCRRPIGTYDPADRPFHGPSPGGPARRRRREHCPGGWRPARQ